MAMKRCRMQDLSRYRHPRKSPESSWARAIGPSAVQKAITLLPSCSGLGLFGLRSIIAPPIHQTRAALMVPVRTRRPITLAPSIIDLRNRFRFSFRPRKLLSLLSIGPLRRIASRQDENRSCYGGELPHSASKDYTGAGRGPAGFGDSDSKSA